MNPTDEVDDLLAKAGAQWRASQPSAPEPDLARITSARPKRRWLVPTLAAASIAAIATALTLLPDHQEPAVAPPPSSPKIMEGTARAGVPTVDDLLVRDGDKVEINGDVLAVPGQDPVFCSSTARPLTGYRPGEEPVPACGPEFAVQLIGIDLGKLSDPKVIKGVSTGRAHVVGTWRDKTITVEQQSAVRPVPPPADRLPCPAPPGGWPSRPSNLMSQPVQDFLNASTDVISGQRMSYPAGRGRNAPMVFAVGVAQGDPAAFRKTFETLYQGNLCVYRGKVTLTENARITETLAELTRSRQDLGIVQAGGSTGDDGLVPVELLVLDENALATLTPLSLDKLRITAAVTPIR